MTTKYTRGNRRRFARLWAKGIQSAAMDRRGCIERSASGCYNSGVPHAPRVSAVCFGLPPMDGRRGTTPRSTEDWLAVAVRIRSGQVAQVVERSPEKAGVGGSTPSLATISFSDLAAQPEI